MPELAAHRGLRPPKQERSRRSLERILQAARGLLSEREVRDVSLREIAETARVSLSSLFARFASKEVLVDHLHQDFCDERLAHVTSVVEALAQADLSLDRIARDGVRVMVVAAREHGGLEHTFHAATHGSESIRLREERFQARRMDLLRSFVHRQLERHGLSPREGEVESVLRLVVAAAPEMIRHAPDDEAGTDELVDTLSDLLLRAVGCSPEPRREAPALPSSTRARTDRMSAATRQRILDAAERVFDGRGLASIRMEEIAELAQVDAETIRLHFEDLRGLLHACLDRVHRESVAWIEERAVWERWEGRSLGAMVREAIELYADGWRRWGGTVRTLRLEERSDDALLRRHRDLDFAVAARIRALAIRIEPTLACHIGSDEPFFRAMATIAAALRTSIDRPALFGLTADMRPEVLVDELTEVALRYVGVS